MRLYEYVGQRVMLPYWQRETSIRIHTCYNYTVLQGYHILDSSTISSTSPACPARTSRISFHALARNRSPCSPTVNAADSLKTH